MDDAPEALVERVARALCLHRAAPACDCRQSGRCRYPIELLLDPAFERVHQARAAIAAVREAGVAPAGGAQLPAAEDEWHGR